MKFFSQNFRFSFRRLFGLMRKEILQIIRDPSTLLVAFLLPVVMLFLFAYAVSLDTHSIAIGVVLESDSEPATSLAAAFSGSRFFSVFPSRDRREVEGQVIAGHLHGYIVIPQDFSQRMLQYNPENVIQIITDAAQPNTAHFLANYAQGVFSNWQVGRHSGVVPIVLQSRFWFNQEIESHSALVPGALAIVMTMIGTLLTALVVSREWERGTMEGLLSTPATVLEIFLGKLLPYFFLGLLATILGSLLAVGVLGVPLRGSVFALLLVSSVFLIPALGQGLLISVLTKNQFISSQIALLSGFLPAFLLSGFLFNISSMPLPIQMLTYIVPARYFSAALQTIFLAGDVWSRLFPLMGALMILGVIFFSCAIAKTRKNLEA